MKTINDKSGFTFVELVLVVALLAVMAVSAIPMLFDSSPMNLDAAIRKVKADIKYAQTMAQTTSAPHGFRVTGNSLYEIYNVTTGTIIDSPHTNAPMQENLASQFGATTFNATTYQVEFDARGEPTLGGGTVIQLNHGTTNNKQLQITAGTGFIQLL